MNGNGRWVKLYSKTAENIFLMKDNNAYIVFTKLLILVNANGQWAGGKHQLAELVNIPAGTLYETLRRLQANRMISIAPNHKYTVYSICNWEKYQSKPNQLFSGKPTVTQPRANREPTVSQHSYKNKNKNKERDFEIDAKLATKEMAAQEPRASAGRKSLGEMFKDMQLKKREATI